jgi:hypothetical protein
MTLTFFDTWIRFVVHYTIQPRNDINFQAKWREILIDKVKCLGILATPRNTESPHIVFVLLLPPFLYFPVRDIFDIVKTFQGVIKDFLKDFSGSFQWLLRFP